MKKQLVIVVAIVVVALIAYALVAAANSDHIAKFELDGWNYTIVDRDGIEKCSLSGIERDSCYLPSDADLYCINYMTKLAIFEAKDRVIAVDLETLDKVVYTDVLQLCGSDISGIATVELLDGEFAIITPDGLSIRSSR